MSVQALLASIAKATAGVAPGVAIVYRLFEDTTFNVATAVQVTTYHDVAIRKVLMDAVTVKDIAAAQGSLQIGDAKFVLSAAELADHLTYASSGDISTSDLIVHGSTTYRVISYTTFGNGVMYRIYGRKLT